ncbi:MAG: hypothetical protein IPK33_22315 [Gemmatimonadetes bacterium]|nr:hypothetical protein [Gemmatimonadota bacterium]
MASVYGDISGHREVLAAACYLGHDDEWRTAIDEWRLILADAGVSHFHATDFFNARKEFAGWSLNDERHVEFAKRFAAVADKAGLVGFAYVMDAAAFREVLAPELEREQRQHKASHDRLYASMCALGAADKFLAKTGYRVRHAIPVTFEHEQGAGRFKSFFNESRQRGERWTWWFQSFETAPKETIPCQLADLLAHEAWRRGSGLLQRSDRAIRKSLQRMLERERLEMRLLTRANAEENARLVRDVLASYPDGLRPPDALGP